MKMNCEKLLSLLLITLVCACNALANSGGSMDKQIQTIKQQALELNRDLLLLEEELLFPNDSRLAVFLSVEVEGFFSMEAVTLSIDGRQVMQFLYTPRQLDALRRGGIHRLYMGNVKAGEHGIVAVFTGRGPEDREYRRATEVTLEKTSDEQNLELKIYHSADLQQPEFVVKEW